MTEEHFEAIVVSPHLDDAVLSCGGQIAERCAAGERVLVVTVAAGDEPRPPHTELAVMLHRAWKLPPPGVVAARRGEDRAACARLGAAARHLGVPEAIYVRGPGDEPLYAEIDDLFVPARADDTRGEEIQASLATLPASDTLLVPLAVGGHVDHRLTRSAAEALGRPLVYYEDYPYAEDDEAVRAALGNGPWHSEVVEISSRAAVAKRLAAAAYVSQVEPLFKGRWRMKRNLARFAQRRGGERIWRRGVDR